MEKLTKNELKFFSKLQQKKYREEHGLFIVQGEKLVNEAIQFIPDAIHCVISTDDSWANKEFVFSKASTKDMERLSSMKSAPEVIALVRMDFNTSTQPSDWTLVLDNIKDPGNLGTIIRIADWFGVNTIICSEKTVDRFNPKVVQSSMGSIFRVTLRYTKLNEWLSQQDIPLFMATMEGENMNTIEFPEKGILALGSESHGFVQLKDYKASTVSIPSKGHAESLNAAVAGGILLSHIIN